MSNPDDENQTLISNIEKKIDDLSQYNKNINSKAIQIRDTLQKQYTEYKNVSTSIEDLQRQAEDLMKESTVNAQELEKAKNENYNLQTRY
jgi:DNA repair ATPase RecN